MYIVFISLLLCCTLYWYRSQKRTIERFGEIKNVLVLNLDERQDRYQETLKEFEKFNIQPQRVSAIKYQPGSLGCTLTHIKALKIAQSNNWDHVMICEDDIQFTANKTLFVQQIDKLLSRHKDWDVIVLGPNILEGTFIDESSARIHRSLCTTCYIVRRHYYDVLLKNFKMAAQKSRKGQPKNEIDVHWHSLQRRDKWWTPLPMLVIQRKSVSNIVENSSQPVDYRKFMMDGFLKRIRNYPEKERLKNLAFE